ncbi:MAG: radical SAM protein [Ferrovibrio sp.]
MPLLDATQYSSDPYTHNYGADKIRTMLLDRYGQRYLDYRADWERADGNWLPDFPINLVFDLVDKCNLACPQCLRAPDLMKDFGGFIGTRKYLEYETIARILDEAKEHKLPSVNIGGSGECTLHPDFIRVCQKVMDTDVCEFRIISNGIKLKGDVASALIDLGVHMVSVSIDGFSAETFGKTRGKAYRYQDVVDNVVAFAKEKQRRGAQWPLLRVSFVEQEENRHETQDFVRFWSDYADMIDVQSYHNFRKTDGYDHSFDCPEPFKRLTIWAYGGAGPCCGFPGIVYNVGDFKTRSIHDIWHGKEIEQVREMARTKNWEKPCLQCQGTRTVL